MNGVARQEVQLLENFHCRDRLGQADGQRRTTKRRRTRARAWGAPLGAAARQHGRVDRVSLTTTKMFPGSSRVLLQTSRRGQRLKFQVNGNPGGQSQFQVTVSVPVVIFSRQNQICDQLNL